MRFAHVGNQAAVRLRNAAQLSNLAQTAHTHLDYGDIRVGLDRQQRLRQTDFVVEVALRFYNLVFGTKAGCQQILRRGLAVRAGNRKNLQALLLQTVGMRQLLISKQRILNLEHRNACRQAFHVMRNNHACCAQLGSLHAVIMTVEIAALKRYEQLARLYGTGVRRHACKIKICYGSLRSCDNLTGFHHFLSLQYSITTSLSSK